MKIKIILLSLITLTIFIVPNFTIQRANATSAGLGVNKSILDIEVPVGFSKTEEIIISNNSTSTPLPIQANLLLWNLKEDSDDIEFVRAEDALNATKWVSITPTDIILEPEEKRILNITIRPPQDASPGSYFVMIDFQPTFPEFYFEESGPRFLPELGALLFIKVPILGLDIEKQPYSADIEYIDPQGVNKIPFVSNILPRAHAGVFDNAVNEVLASVKNNGIFHFKAKGEIVVKNIFGRTVAKTEFPERYFLPNRSRIVDIDIIPKPEKSTSAISNLFRNISYLWRTNSYFGPYTATASLLLPNNQKIIKSINFWIIPWKLFTILGFIIFGLILIIRKLGTRIIVAIKVLFHPKRIKFKKNKP